MSLITRNEKNEPVLQKAAFRCRTCGHLVHALHAGERTHPYACPVCKNGIVYGNTTKGIRAEHPELFAGLSEEEVASRTVTKQLAPGVSICHFAVHENWQVLADAKPEELAEFGLTPESVERHVPAGKNGETRAPKVIVADARDISGIQDRAG